MKTTLSTCFALVCLSRAFALADAQTNRALAALTVPVAGLPAGCALKAPVPPTDARIVLVPAWAPPTNPWVGVDRAVAAEIRRRIDAMPSHPDQIPLSATEARAWQLKWADNVVEAYWATYRAPDESLIDVTAVRFNDEALVRPAPLTPPRGMVTRISFGPTVVLVSSSVDSDCFKAISRYVQSLR